MKLISWNVNGIRAALGKDFLESFKQLDADIFNEAVRRFSPGPWTLSNEEQL